MTRPHPELAAALRNLEDYTHTHNRAIEILDDEITALDWHTSQGDGQPTGTAEHTPVEATLLKLADIEADHAQLCDDRHTIFNIIESALKYAQKITARQPLPKVEVQRCNGKINEQCWNAASDHRVHDPSDGTTTVFEGMCDQCWLAACPACHERPAESWRKVVVDGREVPGCEACARRQWRANRTTTSHSH